MTIILPDNRKPQPPASVLRGPADASAFRVKVGRYGDRWYADPLPACDLAPATDSSWPSVSTVKKAKPFEGANYTAMKRIVAERDGIDFTASPEVLYDTFKTVDRRSLTAAGDRGTHVHEMAEQMLYGRPVDQRGAGSAYYPALAQFFDAYQPELVCAEFVCIHRDLNGVGYGGTADGGLMIEGQLAIVDWKSRGEDADHGAYPEEGAQLAAYARAQYVIADGVGMAKRIPVPAFTAGLIVSIKPDGCVIYPVDLDKAWRYTESLHAWWVARLDEKKHIGKPWPIKAVTVEQHAPAAPVTVGGGDSGPTPDPFDGLTVTEEHGIARHPAPVIWTATMPDETELMANPEDAAKVRGAYEKLTAGQRLVMDAILKEAVEAGVPFGQLERNPTVRRFEAIRVVFRIARHMELDPVNAPRAALRLVMGDKPEVEQAPLGALIGSLTADEARRLALVIEDYGDGKFEEDWSSFPMRLNRAA